MLSDEVRRRLAALNREPLSRPSATAVPRVSLPADEYARSVGGARVGRPPRSERQLASVPKRPLTGEVVKNAYGEHLWIERPLLDLWPRAADMVRSGVRAVRPKNAHAPRRETSWVEPALSEHFPEDVVFLDLETCGLAGSMVFLAGVLYRAGAQWVLSQLWARDYSEEKAMLQSLWDVLAGRGLLVTFNGKSFDWPQVHDRSTFHRLGRRLPSQIDESIRASALATRPAILSPRSWRREPRHVDLLHLCRRRWRHELPNCRLQTLERYICKRHRVDDVSGSEIPDAYHTYVRTGKTDTMRHVLHHNALDLVTLFQLALEFGADSGPAVTR